ncbi:hypothetical protein CGQ24_04290 [Arthrobacter sp. 7749]|nr:hypothetical protein CGQ24_04290 [Arthrobacter sp. 7749]
MRFSKLVSICRVLEFEIGELLVLEK